MREGLDLYTIGDLQDPAAIAEFVLKLKADFEAHIHDGVSARSFDTIRVETLIAANANVGGYAVLTKGTFGGDGSDGYLIITSGTTTINLGSASTVTKNYKSITITGTGKLAFSNPASGGTLIILKSQGAVILTSTATSGCIDISNAGAAGGASVINVNDGNTGTGSNIFLIKTNPGVKGTTANPYVGAGGAVHSLNFNAFNAYQSKYVLMFCGAGGGSGGCASNDAGAASGFGGNGGGAFVLECGGDLNFPATATIYNAGQTGGPQLNNVTGHIGGGGSGGGGSVIVLYKTATSAAGTITVAGVLGGVSSGAASSPGGGGGSITAGTSGLTGGDRNGGTGGTGASLIAQNTEIT